MRGATTAPPSSYESPCRVDQALGRKICETAVGNFFFFGSTCAPRKSTKSLPEVRWGGLEVAQRRQGRSRGACGARDGSGLVLMGPRHATGGHMCHGPGRPSGVNSARNCPAEPHMPAHGPTNEPLSTLLVPTDYPDPLKPAPLRRSPPPAPASSKPRSFRSWRDREFDGLPVATGRPHPFPPTSRCLYVPCPRASAPGLHIDRIPAPTYTNLGVSTWA